MASFLGLVTAIVSLISILLFCYFAEPEATQAGAGLLTTQANRSSPGPGLRSLCEKAGGGAVHRDPGKYGCYGESPNSSTFFRLQSQSELAGEPTSSFAAWR
jgi:hypothetical protein